MSEISSKFKVKKGLDVLGATSMTGDLDVTGSITTPTILATDNSTKVATTAFVKTAIANLISSAPGTLDTLFELASALGNDPNFATTISNNMALKAPLASPVLTGTPTAPTAAVDTNTTQLATTGFVIGQAYAKLSSPTFTGVPAAPTAAALTSTTQLATTAFVTTMGNLKANIASPTFTGVPAAPTAAALTSTTQLATTAFVTTMGNLKANANNAGLTGIPIAPTASAGTNTTQLATTAFVTGGIADAKVDTALTGTPTAPSANVGSNNNQVANTAFVATAVSNGKVNPVLSGDVTFTDGFGSDDSKYIASPGGGRLSTTLASQTGAIKIKLPIGYSDTMLVFDVSVYEYTSGASFNMTVGGYMSASNWSNTFAVLLGMPPSKLPSVRFGNDGTTACVWIGETNSVWAYPQVFVSNVQLGFSGQSKAWLKNWLITFETVFDTVMATTVPTKFAGLASPSFTGVPIAPTASVDTSTVQLATTAFVVGQAYAKLASPALSGTPTVPTAAAGTNSTQIANTAFVKTAIDNLVGAAPGALDTLSELADALGDDPNFAATMSNNLALKAPLASPTLTGIPVAPTAAVDTNTTQLATTGFVIGQTYLKTATAASTYAPLVSPSLTGTPVAPTAATGNSSTTIATTAFVQNSVGYVLTKAITGSVTLTSAEARANVWIFTGALTAAATITVPTLGGRFLVENRTTGGFGLTIKYASGTGVNLIASGKGSFYGDSTNIYPAQTDYTDLVIAGNPTTTTQVTTDTSTRVSTTAFVKNAIAASNTVKNDSTSSADPFGLVTFTNNLSITTNWSDVGVNGAALNTGSYILQIIVNDATAGISNEYYTGTLSWYGSATNSVESDEILLHKAGAGSNGNTLFLRTLRTLSTDVANLKLQIAGNYTATANTSYTFKFRRII